MPLSNIPTPNTAFTPLAQPYVPPSALNPAPPAEAAITGISLPPPTPAGMSSAMKEAEAYEAHLAALAAPSAKVVPMRPQAQPRQTQQQPPQPGSSLLGGARSSSGFGFGGGAGGSQDFRMF
jgi:hypothetical protein